MFRSCANRCAEALCALVLLVSSGHSALGQGEEEVAQIPGVDVCAGRVLPAVPPNQLPDGHYYNPNRVGAGWEVQPWRNGSGQLALRFYWYSYANNRLPRWYETDMITVSGDGLTWAGSLFKRVQNASTVSRVNVGTLGVRRVPNENGVIDDRWLALQWSISDSQGRTGSDTECVVDIFRQAPLGSEDPIREAATHSGFWQFADQSAQDHRAIQLRIAGHNNGSSTEMVFPLTFDSAGQPIWLYGQRANGDGETHDLYLPVWNRQSLTAQCTDNCCRWFGRSASPGNAPYFHRQLDPAEPNVGAARIDLCGLTTNQSCPSQNWTAGQLDVNNCQADFNTSSGPILAWREPSSGIGTLPIVKRNVYPRVVTNVEACELPEGGACDIQVDWTLGDFDGPSSLWRRRVDGPPTDACGQDNPTPSQVCRLSTMPHGSSVFDFASAGRYELQLVQGLHASGEVLARSWQVSIYPNEVPDEELSPVSIPVHDSTVGSLPGQAGVEGGAAVYRIPIEVPPGRRGMAPALELSYSSRAGNGIAGMGWSLGGLSSIHRCPQTPAQDQASTAVRFSIDDRLCLDGRRLIHVGGSPHGTSGAQYRLELDDFSRVTQLGPGNLEAEGGGGGLSTHFVVQHKNGEWAWYGGSDRGIDNGANGRFQPSGVTAAMSWHLVRRDDRYGNVVQYRYIVPVPGEHLLDRILYTGRIGPGGDSAGNRSVEFTYEQRPAGDQSSSYVSGGLTRQTRRLSLITTKAPLEQAPGASATNVYQYRFSYRPSHETRRSLLEGMEQCAWATSAWTCRPPTVLAWQDLPHEVTPNAPRPFRQSPVIIPGLIDPLPFPPFPDPDDPTLPPPPRDRGDLTNYEWAREEHARTVISELIDPSDRAALAAGREVGLANATTNRMLEFRPMGDFDGDGSVEWWARIRTAENQYRTFMLSMSGDRAITGVVEVSINLGNFYWGISERSQPVDINNDGRANPIVNMAIGGGQHRIGFGFWNQATSQFDLAASTIPYYPPNPDPWGVNYSTDVFTGDFNGDGLPDVLLAQPRQQFPAACVSPHAKPVMVYLNTSTGGSPTPTFAAPQLVYCLEARNVGDPFHAARETVQRVGDFDGNGLPDLFIEDSMGTIGLESGPALVKIAMNRSAVSSPLSFQTALLSALGPASQPLDDQELGRLPSSIVLWMDVNGDGLEDMVIGRPEVIGRGIWTLRINKGGRFGPRITVTGHDPRRGLFLDYPRFDGTVPVWPSQRFAHVIRVADHDSDGRADILVPRSFVARMCIKRGPVIPTNDPRCDQLNRDYPRPCETYWMCPEDPVTGDGFGRYQVSLGFWPVADAFKNGFGVWDGSLYRMDALRFRQVGEEAFEVEIVPTDIVGSGAGDLFGDGLQDFIAKSGCPFPLDENGESLCRMMEPGQWSEPGGNLAWLGGAAGVHALAQPMSSRFFVSENEGAGARGSLPPKGLELLEEVVDGWGRKARWEYFPLSSSAGRSEGDLPFYRIPARDSAAGYIDAQHFYFRSTMNAVSEFSQSPGVGSDLNTILYGYTEAMYNNQGRGFQGFRSIAEADLAAGTRRRTVFHQKYPLTSRVEYATVHALGDPDVQTPIERTDVEYCYSVFGPCQSVGPAPPPPLHPYARTTTRTTNDPGPTRFNYSTRIHTVTPDAWGNTVAETVQTQDRYSAAAPAGTRLESTVRHYAPADTAPISGSGAGIGGGWWLDRLTQVEVTNSMTWTSNAPFGPPAPVPSADYLTRRLVSHYGDYDAGRQPGYLIELQPQDVVPPDGTFRRTDFSYDAFGNLASTSLYGAWIADIDSRRLLVDYGPSHGYFANVVTRVLGSTDSAPENHTVTTEFDPRFGQPRQVTDVGGLVTQQTTDPFGFLYRTDYPSAAGQALAPARHQALQWCGFLCGVPGARYRMVTVQLGSPEVRVSFDLLGRELAQDQRAMDQQERFIRTRKEYNRLGLLTRESNPHFVGDTTIGWTEYSGHDLLGRPTLRQSPGPQGPRQTRYVYEGLVTHVDACAQTFNGAGSCQATGPNALLRMKRAHHSAGWLLATEDAAGGIVHYRHDGGGNPVLIRDAVGAEIRANYNGFGMRVRSEDPDRGIWTFDYYASGDLHRQTDGRGWQLRYLHDRLGRVTQELEQRVGQAAPRLLHAWTYDANGKGLPATSQRFDTFGDETYRQNFWYDPLRRPKEEHVLIREKRDPQAGWHGSNNPWLMDRQFRRHLSYHAQAGWLKQEHRGPVGQAVHETTLGALGTYQRRDRFGYVIEEGTSRDWFENRFGWMIEQTDAWGTPTRVILGNGPAGVGLAEHTTTHPVTGQMTRRCVGDSHASCGIVELTYQYDRWGNLQQQQQGGGGPAVAESYLYDELHRLTQATRSGTAGGTVSYAYDAAGGFRYKSDVSAVQPNAFGYQPGTHRLVSLLGPTGATPANFEYDGNGNQTRVVHNGSGLQPRQVSYDAHNRPERISYTVGGNGWFDEHAEFRYGPSGDRYLQRYRKGTTPADKLTLYPFPGYELTATVNVSAPGATFDGARQTLGGWGLRQFRLGMLPRTVWLHTDRLGSPVAKTLTDGTVVVHHVGNLEERHGFDAFGKPRDGAWRDQTPGQSTSAPGTLGRLNSAVTPRGFTGHEHLDGNLRLVHMNGRLYDPLLGRFLSVDPIIQFPENSQSLNPYSYILNNPLSGTDPTGYESCGEVGLDAPGSGTCKFTNAKGRTIEVGYAVGNNGSVAISSSGNMGAISGAVSFGVQKSNGATQGQSSFGVMRTDGLASGPSSLMSNSSRSTTSCGGTTGSNCHVATELRSESSLPRWSKMAEFGAGLSGVGGTALSIYELMTGTSPLSGDSASRGWAAVGVIPYARYLKYTDDIVERRNAYSTLLEVNIARRGRGRREDHFMDANEQLAAMMRSDEEFARTLRQFNVAVPTSSTGRVLGRSPDNWSWHHVHDRPGVLQLVPRQQHQGRGWQHLLHPDRKGGFKIWGSEY